MLILNVMSVMCVLGIQVANWYCYDKHFMWITDGALTLSSNIEKNTLPYVVLTQYEYDTAADAHLQYYCA